VKPKKLPREVGPPKSLPPNRESRNYLKKYFQDFWEDTVFKYKWTVDQWYSNYLGNSAELTGRHIKWRVQNKLMQVPMKLWLENKVEYEEMESLKTMIASEDKENLYLAIVIMKQKAGRKM
jgi:hypothetical protein